MAEQEKTPDQETLITFPCLFPIKVMGEKHATLRADVVEIANKYAPGFIEQSMLIERTSRKGNYLSFTVTVPATSKAQLDALYQAFTAHPKVKVVL
jgi:putative lipoic acid-binding regulatory protein